MTRRKPGTKEAPPDPGAVSLEPLLEADAGFDPHALFQTWFDAAVAAKVPEPTAMALGTVNADGQPSVRIVLLKGFDVRGLVFFTNYESRKARELERNPRAALTFFWPVLHRQIRVEGTVARIDAEESNAYFATRERGSRIGAWASPQSVALPSRAALDERIARLTARFEGQEEIPRPWFWGGYRLAPASFEFWQGRANRLHDRLRFVRVGDSWHRERLAP